MTTDVSLRPLIDVSTRLGRDPMLVQAATGNTSIKVEGILWIKASGVWLKNAAQPGSMVPVDLAEARKCIREKRDITALQSGSSGGILTASIETAMHAVLPHKVVLHVHSVNTISWAVRRDGPAQLMTLLAGLDWQWIPYVASGLPLAVAIQKACSGFPKSNIFVLANHGIVVCGDDCASAEALLEQIEKRVARCPRPAKAPDFGLLKKVAGGSDWSPANLPRVHALSTDTLSRAMLSRGVLYPCQAIFLGPSAPLLSGPVRPDEFARSYERRHGVRPRFLLVEDAGVLVDANMTRAESEMLAGLTEVVQRLDARAPIRYLTGNELSGVLSANAYHYRGLVEDRGSRRAGVRAEKVLMG